MIYIAVVFAEFERAITIDRITTGLTRARAQGHGILKIAKTLGVGTSVVQRVLKSA
jgi:transposase